VLRKIWNPQWLLISEPRFEPGTIVPQRWAHFFCREPLPYTLQFPVNQSFTAEQTCAVVRCAQFCGLGILYTRLHSLSGARLRYVASEIVRRGPRLSAGHSSALHWLLLVTPPSSHTSRQSGWHMHFSPLPIITRFLESNPSSSYLGTNIMANLLHLCILYSQTLRSNECSKFSRIKLYCVYFLLYYVRIILCLRFIVLCLLFIVLCIILCLRFIVLCCTTV
jgi:hypothetical protein